ncbi:DUF2339 domain-containing protein [Denitrobaculum tricleocarpae]|uniref:DUF2339 domain-containing protein n=1 Tax=Denitrobaculum tricleocarpae TaxID=2591009 RepID=UPI0015D41F85|nr:DUF2339 domain-containing protein [Denitrobaculum tricleocarpae]
MFDSIGILIIFALLFLLASSIASWVALSRAGHLRSEVLLLKKRIDELLQDLPGAEQDPAQRDRSQTAATDAAPDRAQDPNPAEPGTPSIGERTGTMVPKLSDQAKDPAENPQPAASEAPKGVWTNQPSQPASGAASETPSREEPETDAAGKPGDVWTNAGAPPAAAVETPGQEARSAGDERIAARQMGVDFEPEKQSFEHNFGARLPVWIGGIAFALGGLFLVKYSIDNNLLSPFVRVLLGGLLGLGLLAAGDIVRKRPNFANGRRIAQSLSGAGIAVLYLAVYAATSLYGLLSPTVGFIGMAAVTATGIMLSLRYGKPIALLGLVFGFITPALIQSDTPSALILFAYLIVLSAGAMALIRQQGWWDLALPTLAASLGWALLWIVSSFGDDMLVVGFFLIAIAGLVAFFNQGHHSKAANAWAPEFDQRTAFGYLGVGGATVAMATGVGLAGYGLTEWGLTAILAIGGIYLAYSDDRQYRLIPWISLAATSLLLFLWKENDLALYAGTLIGFAAIYAASGYALLWKADNAVPWAGLTAATSLGFYLLGYFKLHLAPASPETAVDSTLFWGGLALALAAIAIYSVRRVQEHFRAEAQKEYLLAIFAVAATAFVSLAMTVLLDEKNLPLAFAAEVLAVAWISRRAEIAVLRPVTGILAVIFGGLLVPQILLLVQLTAFSLIELKLPLQASVPLVEQPLIRLGLPALFFIGAATLLRQKADDWLVRGLEIAAIALGAVMGYYLTRHVMNVDANVLYVKAGFLERGIITNVLFFYGLFCFWAGRRFLRASVSWSGAVLCAVALFRIGYFDLFLYNPIWSNQEVVGWPVLNALILPFGLPILWCLLTAREMAFLSKSERTEYWARFLKPVALFLAFTWVTLMIRQGFQGSFLDSFVAGDAEVYSYSVAWILFGIGLLVAGIVTKDQSLRYASLAVTLLAVGKVFLYDTAELEGLYRIFSFFGLGFSLLGLSYVYTRFVFGGKEHAGGEISSEKPSGNPR